jgi:hypothetical protein
MQAPAFERVAAAAPGGGLMRVTTACETDQAGSSDPTRYASNHRIVVTRGGRMLAVYDAHGAAQQITWRDPGGSWETKTTGSVRDGYLKEALNNDRPASLAVGRDRAGAEHAWLVWAGYEDSGRDAKLADVPLKMRRLSALDSSSGPFVGPEVEIAPAGDGKLNPDVVVSGGTGHVVWTERTPIGTYALVTRSFDLDADSPSFGDATVLRADVSPSSAATFVDTPSGPRLVARTGRLELFTLGSSGWERAGDSVGASSQGMPSAVGVDDGDVLAALDDGSGVSVVRFAAGGGAAVEKTFAGRRQPSLASDGNRAWIVMLAADGDLVSRARTPDAGWSSGDRREVSAADGGGDLAWPNLVRDVDDRLQLLVDGPRCPRRLHRNWVLAYERALDEPPSASIAGGRVRERDRGTSTATFRVSLSSPAASQVTVDFVTADRSATAPDDYHASRGSVSFAPGETTASVAVAVNADRRAERNERFSVALADPANATIADGRARATIVDDDLTATRTTLDVRRRGRIWARGSVAPAPSGRRVVVELAKRIDGRFVRVAMRRPVLDVSGDVAGFRARLFRPRTGRCRVTATYLGDRHHGSSTARRWFRCGGR